MPMNRSTRGSVGVAHLFGIEIRLHWTFLTLVFLLAWSNAGGGPRAIWVGLVWVGAVFGSVLVHELAHCLVARRRGAVVNDILLTPIGGMSQLDNIPEASADELAIAIVGPLTSLALAFVAAGLGMAFGAKLWPPTLFAGSWFARLVWLNVLLGGFNLLPALPMDGGRVLRAALARHRDRASATQLAAQVARFLAVSMIAVGFFYSFWLIIIGIFVLLGAKAEEQAAQVSDHHEHDTGDTTGSGQWRPPVRGTRQ
jgi:Zn-dependent protease